MVAFATIDSRQTSAIFAEEPSGTMVLPAGVSTPMGDLPQQVASAGTLVENELHKSTKVAETFQAQKNEQSSGGFDWFEKFHVVPRFFDFGNLVSDQSIPIEVFNAFRRLPKREWTSFVNNAGAGVTLGSIPTLPTSLDPMSGIQMTLDVDTVGPAVVEGTIDFEFTGLYTILVPVTIQRIVLWGLKPEQPFIEGLGFLTNVYPSKDGTEKRESVRPFPRQSWGYEYKMAEGTEAQTLENLLFDFQSLTFAVPVWDEDTVLTADIAAGATVIPVQQTAFRDFRVGGLVVVFTSQQVADVLTIDTGGIASTSITVTSSTVNAYAAGTEVYPVSVCRAQAQIGGARWPAGLRRAQILFAAEDNAVDLGDLTPFSSYKSKLFLDVGNVALSSTVPHGFEQELSIIDGGTGLVFQDSSWDRHKEVEIFTMRAEGRQAVFELRGMVRGLRGRHVTFYAPSDADDLEVVADLVSGLATMDVTNVGFTQFVKQRQPKADLRVSFVDGSPPLLRAIIGSTSPTDVVDQLTMDANWPSTITPAEISRVDFVRKMRMDTDNIRIRHDASGVRAYLVVPLKAVFE